MFRNRLVVDPPKSIVAVIAGPITSLCSTSQKMQRCAAAKQRHDGQMALSKQCLSTTLRTLIRRSVSLLAKRARLHTRWSVNTCTESRGGTYKKTEDALQKAKR